MDFFISIISWLDKIDTVVSSLSLVVSFFTFLLALNIKDKVNKAEDVIVLKLNKDELLGELRAYLLNLNHNLFSIELGQEITTSIIDLESKYTSLPRSVKKEIKRIQKVLKSSNNSDWIKIRKSLNKIITYIERC